MTVANLSPVVETTHPLLRRAQAADQREQMAHAAAQRDYEHELLRAAAKSHLAVFDMPVDPGALTAVQLPPNTYVRVDCDDVTLEYRPDPDWPEQGQWWALRICAGCRAEIVKQACIYNHVSGTLARLGAFERETREYAGWTCPACRERARNGGRAA